MILIAKIFMIFGFLSPALMLVLVLARREDYANEDFDETIFLDLSLMVISLLAGIFCAIGGTMYSGQMLQYEATDARFSALAVSFIIGLAAMIIQIARISHSGVDEMFE